MDRIREAYHVALKLEDGDEVHICLGANLLVVFRKTPLDSASVDIVRKCADHNPRFHIHHGFEFVGSIFDLESPDDPPGPNILDLPNSNEVKFKSIANVDSTAICSLHV
jgi:hypothetical protein